MHVNALAHDRGAENGHVRHDEHPIFDEHAIQRESDRSRHLTYEQPMRHAGIGVRPPLRIDLPHERDQENARACPAYPRRVLHEISGASVVRSRRLRLCLQLLLPVLHLLAQCRQVHIGLLGLREHPAGLLLFLDMMLDHFGKHRDFGVKVVITGR